MTNNTPSGAKKHRESTEPESQQLETKTEEVNSSFYMVNADC